MKSPTYKMATVGGGGEARGAGGGGGDSLMGEVFIRLYTVSPKSVCVCVSPSPVCEWGETG